MAAASQAQQNLVVARTIRGLSFADPLWTHVVVTMLCHAHAYQVINDSRKPRHSTEVAQLTGDLGAFFQIRLLTPG